MFLDSTQSKMSNVRRLQLGTAIKDYVKSFAEPPAPGQVGYISSDFPFPISDAAIKICLENDNPFDPLNDSVRLRRLLELTVTPPPSAQTEELATALDLEVQKVGKLEKEKADLEKELSEANFQVRNLKSNNQAALKNQATTYKKRLCKFKGRFEEACQEIDKYERGYKKLKSNFSELDAKFQSCSDSFNHHGELVKEMSDSMANLEKVRERHEKMVQCNNY